MNPRGNYTDGGQRAPISFNTKALMLKQSQGKTLTKDEKEHVLKQAAILRKKRQK